MQNVKGQDPQKASPSHRLPLTRYVTISHILRARRNGLRTLLPPEHGINKVGRNVSTLLHI